MSTSFSYGFVSFRFVTFPKQARNHAAVERDSSLHSTSFNSYYDAVKWKIFDDSFIRYN